MSIEKEEEKITLMNAAMEELLKSKVMASRQFVCNGCPFCIDTDARPLERRGERTCRHDCSFQDTLTESIEIAHKLGYMRGEHALFKILQTELEERHKEKGETYEQMDEADS